MKVIDPDRSVDEDQDSARRCRGAGEADGSEPPSFARRRALSSSTSVWRPWRSSVARSEIPVSCSAFSARSSSIVTVVRTSTSGSTTTSESTSDDVICDVPSIPLSCASVERRLVDGYHDRWPDDSRLTTSGRSEVAPDDVTQCHTALTSYEHAFDWEQVAGSEPDVQPDGDWSVEGGLFGCAGVRAAGGGCGCGCGVAGSGQGGCAGSG